MASPPNSDIESTYDIFLSFRGEDTRKKFTDHLYKALKQEGFETFRDEEDIERGEDIKSELRKAIWNSKLSIIVLSKNFANSTTCLFEIQTILEHRKKSDHLILPVFYEVEPREIKEQARYLDFAEKEVPVEEVKGWSAALKEVANMAGMVSQNQSGGYEAKFIEDIIGELKSKLNGVRPRVADRLDGSSLDIQGNTAGTSGSSWFGSFWSQLFQNTVGLLFGFSAHWAENPSEEATLPPPPLNAAFQNRMPNNTPKDERKVDNSQCNGGSHHESQSPLEMNLANQPIPCSSDQLSARGRMGIRARYVDTFNKGGAAPPNLFQLPSPPAGKPGVGFNDLLIEKFPSDSQVYNSFNSALGGSQQFQQLEYLRSLTPNGLPPHRLVQVVFTDRNYRFLHQISDRTIIWKIKVRVIRITGPSPSKDGQSTYKRFLLQDEKRDTIQATLFQSNFERFNDTLELHKTYFLSRAVLTKIDPQYKPATSNGHDCEMIIKSYTCVERDEDSVTNPPTQEFNFLPLSTLSQLSSPPPHIDIVGIVVGVSHKEKRKRKRDSMDFSIREIMLTDDTRKITKVTTWGAFIYNECETLSNHLQDKPVVVITNVKLKEIHGCMTISTTQSSVILINPGMPEARQLESWKMENVEYLLNTWTDNESSSNIRTTTIKEISESPNREKDYYVKAFVTSILPQEKCWYMSCNICHKKTDEPINTIFTCKNCQRKNVTAEPWCCVRVELGDATGVLPATLFGRHAEKVLACEAKALFNLDIEEQLDLMERWCTEWTTTEFVFHVKVAQQRNSLRLDVMSVDDV